jgi:tRNA dimethylallyltransferase
MHKYLIVIAGPTAVGKTALSIALARHFNTEVLSADARQFFREMSIGTAKPTAEEMQGVKHHFINSHSISEPYSVGQYEQDALACLGQVFKEKDMAIMVGGSGLYIKAVCEGIDVMPEVAPHIRTELQQILEQQGLPVLQKELQERDPAYYQQVDLNNPQRVIRALEICRATGQPYTIFRTGKKAHRPFTIIKIGLQLPRPLLYQRIDMRMDLMLEQGLKEEAIQLLPFKHLNALQTVGYKEIYDHLEGQYDWEEAVRLLKRNSRRYAKRQLTWFGQDEEMEWFEPGQYAAILQYISDKLRAEQAES